MRLVLGLRGKKMGTAVEGETAMGKRALRFSMVLVPGEGKGGGCFLLWGMRVSV